MSRAYRVNLSVLALVALFTGGLLVFSTQALAVVRRRAQFALVRTLGVRRRRLTALVVAEGAALGVAGSAIGLAGGYAFAVVALRWFGADLGAGYFRGVAPSASFDPFDAALFGLLGIVAAILGSIAPALEAARAVPAAALKAGDEESAFARLRSPWPGTRVPRAGRRHRRVAARRWPAAVRLWRHRVAARGNAGAAAAHRRRFCSHGCRGPRRHRPRWRSTSCAARRARPA